MRGCTRLSFEVQSQQRSQFRTKIPGISSTQSSNDNMSTRTERFQRKPKEKEEEVPEAPEEVIRFPPEKEAVRHCPKSCVHTADSSTVPP